MCTRATSHNQYGDARLRISRPASLSSMKDIVSEFTHYTQVGIERMGFYARFPDAQRSIPGMVVIQHASGVDEFTRAMVDRLADAGYAAAAPQLYHRLTEQRPALEMMKQLRDTEVIVDVNAAIDWLGVQAGVDAARLGIIGFCMGGRVSYMMAAANPRLKAAVVYYGGNIMQPWGDDAPAPFARTTEIGCPILFHFGAEDANPSPADRRVLDAELKRYGKFHEFYNYPGAGHAFMNFSAPERFRAGPSELSWSRTLGFLAVQLGKA